MPKQVYGAMEGLSKRAAKMFGYIPFGLSVPCGKVPFRIYAHSEYQPPQSSISEIGGLDVLKGTFRIFQFCNSAVFAGILNVSAVR
jgi:hypothetical protein